MNQYHCNILEQGKHFAKLFDNVVISCICTNLLSVSLHLFPDKNITYMKYIVMRINIKLYENGNLTLFISNSASNVTQDNLDPIQISLLTECSELGGQDNLGVTYQDI